LGAGDLASVLGEFEDVVFDDAAPIIDSDLLASTDFFSSPFNDPYLSGRVAALHCASDLIGTGAKPHCALANVVLPQGDARSQREALRDLLAGAKLEFEAMEAKLIGGHTIVGPQMEVGFTIIGRQAGPTLVRKSNLQIGDQLFLTKSLGTGIVLAAHMRAMCSAFAYSCLVDQMLERQHAILPVALDCGVRAGTDVTGFGLVGHLIEMLNASDLSARIQLTELTFLLGTAEYLQAGVESSLAPANRRFESQMDDTDAARQWPLYPALFDPQTCGGLLLGVPADQADRFQSSVIDLGLPAPSRIGCVIESQGSPRLSLVR
jgi:selenide,water dikinase